MFCPRRATIVETWPTMLGTLRLTMTSRAGPASATGSTAVGYQNEAFAADSTAMGRGNITRGIGSLAMGFTNEIGADAQFGIGP